MTIMNRRTFRIKSGELENAVAMLIAERERSDFPGRVSIYHSLTGELNQVIVEYTFTDLAHYERAWAEWSASAGAAEFFRQWSPLVLPGSTNELFYKDAES